jgi:hypothetical protein
MHAPTIPVRITNKSQPIREPLRNPDSGVEAMLTSALIQVTAQPTTTMRMIGAIAESAASSTDSKSARATTGFRVPDSPCGLPYAS